MICESRSRSAHDGTVILPRYRVQSLRANVSTGGPHKSWFTTVVWRARTKGSEKRIKRGGQRKEREREQFALRRERNKKRAPKRKTIGRYHASDGRRSLAGESGTEVCTRGQPMRQKRRKRFTKPLGGHRPSSSSSFSSSRYSPRVVVSVAATDDCGTDRMDRMPTSFVVLVPEDPLAPALRVPLLTRTFLIPVDERDHSPFLLRCLHSCQLMSTGLRGYLFRVVFLLSLPPILVLYPVFRPSGWIDRWPELSR